jgi:hypothetical protein
MKITIEIKGTDYTFEMNRAMYKKLLADEDYARVQNEISKQVQAKANAKKNQEEIEEDLIYDNVSAMVLRNMVMEEQLFYYGLLSNQPTITKEEALNILESAIFEYGDREVAGLCSKLMENFTPVGEEPKKKMVMRMS